MPQAYVVHGNPSYGGLMDHTMHISAENAALERGWEVWLSNAELSQALPMTGDLSQVPNIAALIKRDKSGSSLCDCISLNSL